MGVTTEVDQSDDASPSISLVTASYNSTAFLDRLYSSLCRQSYRNFEWIVVDDGSSDGTVEAVRALPCPWDGGIKLFKLPANSGGPLALGLGVSRARGDLVMILDHDDELTSDALQHIADSWPRIRSREDIAGLVFPEVDARTGGCIGGVLTPGTEVSMSWLFNVKPEICDIVQVLKTNVATNFFNPPYMEGIVLNGVPYAAITRSRKLLATGSTGIRIYHRDNPDSQTNSPKISWKTVYTYAKMVDLFDRYYLLHPIRWTKHVTAMLAYSRQVYGTSWHAMRHLRKRRSKLLALACLPLAALRHGLGRRERLITYPQADLAAIEALEDLRAASSPAAAAALVADSAGEA